MSTANHYELLAIVDGRIADSELEGFRATLEEILKKHVSQIHYTHNLGRRKLAYPIKHQAHGIYLLCEFDAPTAAISKLERALALTSELLRHCIVRRKTIGAPVPLERREEEPRARTMRKTQDDELLGRTPLEEIITAPPAPAVPIPIPAEHVTTEKPPAEALTPKEGMVSQEDKPAVTDDGSKKKGQKISYEDLDKKLNELLSDDII